MQSSCFSLNHDSSFNYWEFSSVLVPLSDSSSLKKLNSFFLVEMNYMLIVRKRKYIMKK